MLVNKISGLNFKGTTKCYVTSDVHQEAKRFADFLEKISKNSRNLSNVLLLNNGDLFGGIYSRNLTKKLLIDFKKQNKDIEVVTGLGNNDFISEPGYDEPEIKLNPETQHQFLKTTIKDFNDAGIKVVCANIKDKNNKQPEGIKPYSIVCRDGDRILITGYCVERTDKALKNNYNLLKEEDTVNLLEKWVEDEKPDAIVLLNHDYEGPCKKIKQLAEDKGIKIDFIVGGHDHEHLYHNPEEKIIVPAPFARQMFTFNLSIPAKQQKNHPK